MKKAFFILFLILASLSAQAWAADVVMNVTAKNSTAERQEKLPVRQDLPREVKKEDVVDTAGMQILFDADKSVYYLYAECDLNPDETKNFRIVVKDVWNIPAEQIDFLKNQTDLRLKAMEKKPNYDVGKTYHDKLINQLDAMQTLQASQRTDINSRIESYRLNVQEMNDVRKSVTLPDDFVKEAELDAEVQKERKIIKFVVEVSNPSATDPMEQVEILRYLPLGVKPQQILDNQGFQIRYDASKSLYYLIRYDDLKAGETKKYEIQILDVWHIPNAKLEGLESLAQDLTNRTGGTQFAQPAAFIMVEIKKYIAEIKESQDRAISPIDKIATYGINLTKLDAINAKIEELRKMVQAIDKAESRKITSIVKSVAPDIATTWKLIYWTIGFLAVISVFFFILWFGQAKARQAQKVEMQELFKDEE